MALLFRNLLAQSALAGWADGEFCRRMAEAGLGLVTLGGYNADHATHGAGVLVGRRRKEFMVNPEDLADNLRSQALLVRPTGARVSVNIRFSEPEQLKRLSELEEVVDLIELNAHCRQPEFTAVGAGEALLHRLLVLREAVGICADRIPTIVKVRAIRMPKELPGILMDAGAAGIHLDLMKPGTPRADLSMLAAIRSSSEIPIIGNNSVRAEDDFLGMLGAGADMVSMGRALLRGPAPARAILESPECISAMESRPSQVPGGYTPLRQGPGNPRGVLRRKDLT